MEKIASQLDADGYFIGGVVADESPLEPGVFLIPGGAIDIEPPEARAGMRFKPAQDATWIEEEDHRNEVLYLITDGAPYQLGRDVSGQTYSGAGPLPPWLTSEQRPGPFHKWVSGAWVFDEAAQVEAEISAERAWRDAESARIAWVRERHRDELDADLETSLRKAQFAELLGYIQSLRDWPKDPDFPAQHARPVRPTWLDVIL